MIAPLRRRHRRMVAIVGLVTLLGIVAALAARPDRPAAIQQPVLARGGTPLGSTGVRATREPQRTGERITLVRPADLTVPDLLVYWVPTDRPVDELPADAVLLGPLGNAGSVTFSLPAAEVDGHLTLSSLGHDRVLASEAVRSIERLENDR